MKQVALLWAVTLCQIAVAPVLAEDLSFDSAGVKIRYIDQGPRDGEPVILIHGGFSRAEAWAGVIDALDERYRVIAPDLRGHGKSDKLHDPRQYGGNFVDDITRLMDHLDIEKAHIVGYSMGGRITFMLVADHPERLISAMPNGTDGEPPSKGQVALLERTAALLEETGSIRPVLEHFNTDGAMTDEQIEEIVDTIGAGSDARALAAVARSVEAIRADRAKLETNPVPCRVLIGEHDPNRKALAITAGYMPNLEVEIIRGANHLTVLGDPAFVTGIAEFLGEQTGATESP